jgi:hypothetical protein
MLEIVKNRMLKCLLSVIPTDVLKRVEQPSSSGISHLKGKVGQSLRIRKKLLPYFLLLPNELDYV